MATLIVAAVIGLAYLKPTLAEPLGIGGTTAAAIAGLATRQR